MPRERKGPASRPSLDLRDLGQLVVATPDAEPGPRTRPEPRRRRERWGWHFAGWMGPMYGPVPVGHLALGLIGLYFKLR
jgi:hypothetical protein